jgi:hypothetical protein
VEDLQECCPSRDQECLICTIKEHISTKPICGFVKENIAATTTLLAPHMLCPHCKFHDVNCLVKHHYTKYPACKMLKYGLQEFQLCPFCQEKEVKCLVLDHPNNNYDQGKKYSLRIYEHSFIFQGLLFFYLR